jgi:truncated hemoglobin YjbI
MNKTSMSPKTLYEKIGEDRMAKIVTDFYVKAFADPIISHFFFGKDRADITKKQIDFVRGLLGGPMSYGGRPLPEAHENLAIKIAHFQRRQVLMEEILTLHELPQALKEGWLALEDKLKNLIIRQSQAK